MKVILTVQDGDGQLRNVGAEGDTYERAKTAAEAMNPDGSSAIAIHPA